MSVAELVVDVGVTGRDRARLRDHLAESRTAMTSPLEQMDRAFFRMSAEEVRLETPATKALDVIVAAAGKGEGPLRVVLPDLSKQDRYILSFALEASTRRATSDWLDPAGTVASAVSRIAEAVDAVLGVSGTPGERSYWRSPLAYKPRPGRPDKRKATVLDG